MKEKINLRIQFYTRFILATSVALLLRTEITEAGYTGPTTTAGVDLIKFYEGFRANFYLDPAGIRTIGYGHACNFGNKCADIIPPLTRQEATSLLLKDLKEFEKCVTKNVRYKKLNDVQFSALVSFSFNLGCGKLRSSTLLRQLNAGNTKLASVEFGKWVNSNGKRLPGLVARREAERILFCSKGGC